MYAIKKALVNRCTRERRRAAVGRDGSASGVYRTRRAARTELFVFKYKYKINNTYTVIVYQTDPV